MQPDNHRHNQELISLAQETRLVADSITDSVIHDRLIEIADELLDLAGSEEKSNHESRGYGWPA